MCNIFMFWQMKKVADFSSKSTTLSVGGKGSRTPDLLNAIQALYQLSYTPKVRTFGMIRIAPPLVKRGWICLTFY